MDCNSEDEDDWFYDSIQRYKQLQMFEFENVTKQMEFSDPKSICVASSHQSGQDEILELSLPKKITVTEDQEGLTKNSDLKMKNGGFLQSSLIQMKILFGRQRIITSEKDHKGISLYQLGSENSDVISRISSFHNELLEPRLTTNNMNLLVMATTNSEGLKVMDINAGRDLDTIMWNKELKKHKVMPEFVSPNSVAVCNISNGTVDLVDIRTKHTSCVVLPGTGGSNNGEEWSISSSFYGNSNEDVNLVKIGLLSTMGTVSIYDLRSNKESVCRSSVNQTWGPRGTPNAQSLIKIQFCPVNSSVISVSGFDENVYIYNIDVSDELKSIFIHDGHSKQINNGGENIITCHLWYQENTIISASENKTLHCWQYISSDV